MFQTIVNGAPDPRCPGQTRVTSFLHGLHGTVSQFLELSLSTMSPSLSSVCTWVFRVEFDVIGGGLEQLVWCLLHMWSLLHVMSVFYLHMWSVLHVISFEVPT
jgi:hypothetical protein